MKKRGDRPRGSLFRGSGSGGGRRPSGAAAGDGGDDNGSDGDDDDVDNGRDTADQQGGGGDDKGGEGGTKQRGGVATGGVGDLKVFRQIRSSITDGVKGTIAITDNVAKGAMAGVKGTIAITDNVAKGAAKGAMAIGRLGSNTGGTNARDQQQQEAKERPSYRLSEKQQQQQNQDNDSDDEEEEDEEEEDIDDPAFKQESIVKAKHIQQSAGTHRLQRILNKQQEEQELQQLLQQQQQQQQTDGTTSTSNKTATNSSALSNADLFYSSDHYPRQQQQQQASGTAGAVVAAERLADAGAAKDVARVSRFVANVVLPPLAVDFASIGGHLLRNEMKKNVNTTTSNNETNKYYPEDMVQEVLVLLPCRSFESTAGQDTVTHSALQYPKEYTKHKRSLGLLAGGAGGGPGGGGGGLGGASVHALGRVQKLRYVCLARSTNRPLDPTAVVVASSSIHNQKDKDSNHNNETLKKKEKEKTFLSSKKDQDESSDHGDYDTMFDQSSTGSLAGDDSSSIIRLLDDDSNVMSSPLASVASPATKDGKMSKRERKPTDIYHQRSASGTSVDLDELDEDDDDDDEEDEGKIDKKNVNTNKKKEDDKKKNEEEEAALLLKNAKSAEDEIASFPVLVCMTLNSDGTAPDIRKLVPLQTLTTIQNLHATVAQLAFDNGDTIRLDFLTSDEKVAQASLDKERFIWSLIQVHAMLCLSVVERNSIALSATATSSSAAAKNSSRVLLPPLNVRNLDRAELQYVATVNGFLTKNKQMCTLIDRQEKYLQNEHDRDEIMASATATAGTSTPTKKDNEAILAQQRPERSEKLDMERRDRMAYDLMMGNINMRVSLFHSEEERKDSEEILNSTEWTLSLNNNSNKEESSTAAVSVAERLALVLQWRMRDLEAETCRRLIAWEDEKHFSSTGQQQKLHTANDERDTVDALALASLFKTLEALDTELQDMEVWLQERAAAIKPLTDDCADIEEENRQLEQQWKSYDMLGSEMRRLLQGMDLDEEVERVLKNPASALVYDDGGRVNVEQSEEGVDLIYQSGKALQEAMDYPMKSGGLHLDAVSERTGRLGGIATSFCTALAHIVVTVMEQFNEEVLAGSDYGKVSKNDTHSMIAKKVRDTQRKFQSALLGYIKLIEILAALSPDMLPALRDAYSEMVAESILMKKRMKGYFQALPGKNAAYMNKAGKDLKDYVPFNDEVLEMVNAPDIKAALSELLPVIAREAYFTSALFGAASKEQDGREKKRNFESTRKAVDNASQHFRYYIERTCGILPDQIAGRSTIEAGVKGDPLLCLVGSIYLNEAMDNYIDREKKGGDHSLSLAYVRASILDLRRCGDRQWVGWVDKQILWIRTHDGVPVNGKRSGIFPSFARFPSYLDHVLLACSEGREDNYVPDIINIKVINYYLQKLAATLLESLKECAERESTDQQYAANVMQMENTYFFTQAIKHRNPVFAELFAKQVTKANAICKESTDSYLGWMIKREFATLHELFSRVSKLRKEVGDKQVPSQVPKASFVRVLQKEANKDVLKEKIGIMYSRMEKHLSEEGRLLPVAWKALVKVLYEWFGRWEKLCTQIYGYTLKPSAVDIVRIAKAAGGATKPKQGSNSDFGFKSILALGNKTPA